MPDLPAHITCPGSDLPELAWVGPENFDMDLWVDVQNRSWNKPHGGLWASPVTPGGSVWTEWLEYEMPPSSPYYYSYLEIDPEAQFLVIDDYKSFRLLLDNFTTGGPDSEGLALAGLCVEFLDFEAIGKNWAGIYLTDEGQALTRYPKGSGFSVMGGPSLYGWDLECVLFLQREAIAGSTVPFSFPFISEEDQEDLLYS